MTNFKTAMQELSDAFTKGQSDSGDRFYTLKDEAPAWIGERDVVYEAHKAIDGRLPDDWIYEAVHAIACNLNVYDESDEAQEESSEICDGLVDIYTAKLTSWLASHLGNLALCDEAVSEGLVSEDSSIEDRIKVGQCVAYQRIAASVISSVEAEAESRDELEECA